MLFELFQVCIERKLPGAGCVTRLVYDAADRLIFSQDSLQSARQEWTGILYDGLGREVVRASFPGQCGGEGGACGKGWYR